MFDKNIEQILVLDTGLILKWHDYFRPNYKLRGQLFWGYFTKQILVSSYGLVQFFIIKIDIYEDITLDHCQFKTSKRLLTPIHFSSIQHYGYSYH